jgi:hypothetical protein
MPTSPTGHTGSNASLDRASVRHAPRPRKQCLAPRPAGRPSLAESPMPRECAPQRGPVRVAQGSQMRVGKATRTRGGVRTHGHGVACGRPYAAPPGPNPRPSRHESSVQPVQAGRRPGCMSQNSASPMCGFPETSRHVSLHQPRGACDGPGSATQATRTATGPASRPIRAQERPQTS